MKEETIKKLAQARADAEKSQAALKAIREDFEKSEAYTTAVANLAAATVALTTTDLNFRIEALATFKADENKHADAYEVKDETTVSIPNEAAALGWCRKNYTPAIRLDVKEFSRAAKAGSIPAKLATVKVEPKIYVKGDLSAWLKEGGTE
jgi:hypothetical protein